MTEMHDERPFGRAAFGRVGGPGRPGHPAARSRRTALRAVASAVVAAIPLAACSGGDSDAGPTISVAATDTTCSPSATSATAGTTHFTLTNKGKRVTELYIMRADGSIAAERENIGPGTTATLTAELGAGDYKIRCRPGGTGEGVYAALKVTGEVKAAASDPRLTSAVDTYRQYVLEQSKASLAGAAQLRAAIAAGDVAKAKALYPASRVGWERIEPVAESFGDIDPKVDLREADLAAGQTWTGWHVIEKGLWVTNSTAGLLPVADQLIVDLKDLVARVPGAQITPTSMANGAKELLDEVATGKVTGEEETFSHTDLVDFQANIDGAQTVHELLQPVVTVTNRDLATRVDAAFSALQQRLSTLRTGAAGTAFVSYDKVDEQTRRALSADVNALAEPLSGLAAAVAS